LSQTRQNDRLYNAIVHKVFSREVNAGQRLVERELATELNVSRVPVRETLAKLVAQGILVGGAKGQGVFVRQYSAEDVRQLYEFRLILEAGAAATAAEAGTESELLRMEMICDEMEAEIEHFESPRWRDLDHKFHETLGAASGNQRIINVIKSMLVECFFMFYAPSDAPVDSPEMQSAIAERVIFEHRTIVEAIRSQDASAAADAAKVHVNWVGDLARRVCIAQELKV